MINLHQKIRKWVLVFFTSALSFSAIGAIALSCSNQPPKEYLNKAFFKPKIIINDKFDTKTLTAKEAYDLAKINPDGSSNIVSFDDKKPFASYVVTNINIDDLFLKIDYEVRVNEYKIVHKFTTYSGEYLTEQQKALLVQTQNNLKQVHEAISHSDTNNENFYDVRIKPEYQRLSALEMKIKGDDLVTFVKDDPNYQFKNNPLYKGINLKIIDIKISEKIETTNDPIYLIFDLKISKGTPPTQGFVIKHVIKKVQG